MRIEARQTLSLSNAILPRNHKELDLSRMLIVYKIVMRFNSDATEFLNAKYIIST